MIYVTKFQETTGRIRASINRGSATWTPLWDVADANYVERIKSKLIWSNLKSSKNRFQISYMALLARTEMNRSVDMGEQVYAFIERLRNPAARANSSIAPNQRMDQ